jgi:hypothetical protein
VEIAAGRVTRMTIRRPARHGPLDPRCRPPPCRSGAQSKFSGDTSSVVGSEHVRSGTSSDCGSVERSRHGVRSAW